MTGDGELGIIDTQPASKDPEMRDNKVMIRLNDGEKKLLDDVAGSLDMPTSSWARNLLIRAAQSEISVEPRPTINGKDKAPPLLSLFCGVGGLDEGFKQAGFKAALAFDNDDECVRAFNANHGNAYVRDVTELTLEELDSLNGGEFRPVGIIGGPPCQSFSVSNVHQKDDDPRHQLPESYARLLKKLNERNPISFFLFENVPGLLGKRHIDRYLRFKKMFQKAGFEVHEELLDAKYYGVPQERQRIFIVGINRDLHPDCEWITPKPETKIKTVRETIEGLPEPIYNERGLNPDTFPVHQNHWCLVPRSKKFVNADLKEGQAWGAKLSNALLG